MQEMLNAVHWRNTILHKLLLSCAAYADSMPCVWESVAPLARKSSASQASDRSLQTYCTTVATRTQPLDYIYMAAAIQNCMSEI